MRTVDMHCDTIYALLKKKRAQEEASLLESDCHLDIRKMKKGDYLLQNFALFVEMKACEDPWQEVQALFGLYMQELLKNSDSIAPALTFADIEKNRREGLISAMLTVEEGGVCKGDLKKLDTLYKQGVRMMTLMWNYANGLGYPNLDKENRKKLEIAKQGGNFSVENMVTLHYLNTPNTKDGLTGKGLAFVERMEELGMVVDVSHMSDAGFEDVFAHTTKPFVASHSNAREICPCARNLSDVMIKKLAVRGGVMGLNYCADFLTQMPVGVKNPGTIEAIVKHAQHIVRTGGIECLGLGSDFDGIDTHEELSGADKMGLLWEALHEAGFTEGQLDKIFTDNVLRVYKDILT